MRMAGKAVVVTGAAGDIGRAFAVGFAAEGARIACLDIDEEGTRETVGLVRGAGGDALGLTCDVTVWPEVVEGRDKIAAAYGRIDVLLANAGGNEGVTTPFLEMTPEIWRRMVERNLTGAFYCGLVYGRHMADHGGGAIVYTSSQLSETVRPGLVHYAAAKGGVRQLVRGMAVDLAPHGIRVNAVAPGPTLTRGTQALFERPDVRAVNERTIPLGRVARPDEIVGAALYLASDEASFTTGATLMVDGGYTIV